MNSMAGRAAGQKQHDTAALTITTALIAAGPVRIPFLFTPTRFTMSAFNAAGTPELAITDTFAISGDDIVVTLIGGGGDLANTDILYVTAYE
jgi:hypothetical protein